MSVAARRPHIPPAQDARSGVLLMVASAAWFAGMAAIAKRWLPDTPAQAIVLSRGILMSVVLVAIARGRRVPIVGRQVRMLVVRGLLGYAALSCYFWSVQQLPLGDAVLLQYAHPIFVAALAPIVLAERTSRGHWVLVSLALGGVALVVGPSGELRGAAAIALCGALCSGLAYLAIRKLSRTEHPLTIMVWFPLLTVPGSLTASLFAGAESLPRHAGEVAAHLGVAATALAGQITLTRGLARVDAARGTAATMTGPVFGVLFGLALFGTVPSPTSLVGMLVVGACAVLLARGRPATD
ncbi:MAG: DMT family transporter [Planctomycetes bacterium]|nr:DMT family transporter [Planctomycetota bacterium]